MGLATLVAVTHEPSLLQDGEMLRDGRLRDPSPSRERADGPLAVTDLAARKLPVASGRRAF